MRIALDIRRMSDYGVATYLRNVVRTLGRIDHKNEYILMGGPECLAGVDELPENFQRVPFPSEISAGNYFELRRILRDYRADILHIPHLFWHPLLLPCPYVMTVHDLLDHMYRASARSALGRVTHFYFTRQVLHRAARIFSVSNYTKTDLQRFFQVRPEKIEVVHNALDDSFMLGHTTREEREMLVERYQINTPFILYAGRISPHKNVVRIIEAFSALKTELSKDGRLPDLKLIIIGDELNKHPDLRRAVIRSGVSNDVRFLGFIPIDVLRIFYDAAKVFVFPSLYEGFGLPPLEAMAHGTPVVASNAAALPEVVGGAALMVNPENVFEISKAMFRALTDLELREQMKSAGWVQAQKFSWEKSVRRMIEVYESVVAEKAQKANKAAAIQY